MKYLEDIIIKQGKILPGDILKVDSFLNHQINVKVLNEIGKEFGEHFKNSGANKILTIESSGIAVAQSLAINMNIENIVYAKKGNPSNISNDCYEALEKSYTKGKEYSVKVSKEYLNSNDKVIIVDDFLAKGEAMMALLNICNQACAEVKGIGIVIGKMYQGGYERIKDKCDNIQILAKVKSMSDDGKIEFED